MAMTDNAGVKLYRIWVALSLVILCAFCATGCGKDKLIFVADPGGVGVSVPAPDPTPTPTPTPDPSPSPTSSPSPSPSPTPTPSPSPPPPDPEATGRLQVNQVLLRAVPDSITHLRVTGYDQDFQVRFGAQTRPKSTSVLFEPLPISVRVVLIEYLASGQLRGIGQHQVQILANQTTILNNPHFFDVTSELVGLEVTPANQVVPVGVPVQFTATGTFADDSILNLTSLVTWSSSEDLTVEIDELGRALGLSTGSVTISATLGPVQDETSLEIEDAVIEQLSVLPLNPDLPNGFALQFQAVGVFSNGTQQNLTSVANWESSDEDVATINTTGLATAVGVGQTTISASFGGQNDLSLLNVAPSGGLRDLVIVPANAVSAPGATREYRALGTLDDGTELDLTSAVHWSADDPNVATISNVNFGTQYQGLATVTGSDGDEVTIRASLQGVDDAEAQLRIRAGSFVYVTNRGAFQVSMYSGDVDGTLNELDPLTIAVGNPPNSAAVHPSSQYLYVGDSPGGQGRVHMLEVQNDGQLLLLSPPNVTTGEGQLQSLAIHPNGRFLYVGGGAANTPGSVFVYPIDESGVAASTPIQTATSIDRATSLAIDPGGRFLFATGSPTAATSGAISRFQIESDGTLTSLGANTVDGVGLGPTSVKIHPNGNFLYIVNAHFNNAATEHVSAYRIETDGQLTHLGSLGSAGFIRSLSALSPSGSHLYVAKSALGTDASLSIYEVQANGSLSFVGDSDTINQAARGVAADSSGQFLYLTAGGPTALIAEFEVDSVDGTLTLIRPAISTSSTPEVIVTVP